MLNPLASIFRIIDEATREKIEDPVSQVFHHKKVVDLTKEAVLVSRSGQESPIEDTAAPILSADGEMLGVVLVFNDATEIRRAQHALREHSDELERQVSERTATLQQAVLDLQAFSYTDLARPALALARRAGFCRGAAGGLWGKTRRAGPQLSDADQERGRAARPAHPGPAFLHPALA